MKEADNEHVLRCLDSALRVFRGSRSRPSVADIKIQSLLEVVRRTVAHQPAGDHGERPSAAATGLPGADAFSRRS